MFGLFGWMIIIAYYWYYSVNWILLLLFGELNIIATIRWWNIWPTEYLVQLYSNSAGHNQPLSAVYISILMASQQDLERWAPSTMSSYSIKYFGVWNKCKLTSWNRSAFRQRYSKPSLRHWARFMQNFNEILIKHFSCWSHLPLIVLARS